MHIVLKPIKNPARLQWHEVKKVDHYYLSIDAVTQPMQVREKIEPYGDKKTWWPPFSLPFDGGGRRVGVSTF